MHTEVQRPLFFLRQSRPSLPAWPRRSSQRSQCVAQLARCFAGYTPSTTNPVRRADSLLIGRMAWYSAES